MNKKPADLRYLKKSLSALKFSKTKDDNYMKREKTAEIVFKNSFKNNTICLEKGGR